MAGTMRKVSLRNLGAHKLRLLLTVLSVVLGTSFVAGSLIFTSTIGRSFNDIFDNVAIGVDAQVSSSNQSNGLTSDLGVPQSVVDKIQSDKAALGVDRVQVGYTGTIAIADSTGKAMQSGGAPIVGANWVPTDQALDPNGARITQGRAPSGPNEIVLNESAATKGSLKVGSRTKVVVENGDGTPRDVTVVGLTKMPGATSGYIEADFDAATARSLFSDGKHVGTVQVSAASGVTPDQLKQRLAQAFPDQKVQTGEEVRQQTKDAINRFLQIFNYILLSFAAIGLIVGTFIIYNTFSMIVAQRVKELALLRAVGASRPQVTRSVLFEAFVVGLIGSVVGFAIGIALAAGLQAILSSTGAGLPSGDLAITPTAVIACLLVGIVVTMVSAYAPARRAAQVSPVEAMRESQTDGASSLRVRTLIGALLAVLGFAAIFSGATGKGGQAAGLVGLGAVVIIVAVVMGAPALSQPVIGALGSVIGRPFGKLGRLARTNAVRNPRRTAATAFALTLGLMLVAVIGTLGSSFKATIDSAVSSDVTADVILTGGDQMGLPPASGATLAKLDGVKDVVQLRNVPVRIGGSDSVGTAPTGDLSTVLKLAVTQGSSTIGANSVLVSDKFASANGLKVGSPVELATRFGTKANPTVTGIYTESALSGPFMLGGSAYSQLVPKQLERSWVTLVKVTDGAPVAQVQNRIGDAMKDYLTIKVQTPKEFANAQSSQIDQMLLVLYGMLGLSLVIAVLGIINTLALSVVERKREIGMLRAVGMLRKQVRRTIYLESILISIFGALLGMIIGVAIGWCLVRTFREWIPDISAVIPWPTILFTLVMAAVVGMAAALWPGIRAARTRPLEAIADL